jgi:hypothetical protein
MNATKGAFSSAVGKEFSEENDAEFLPPVQIRKEALISFFFSLESGS